MLECSDLTVRYPDGTLALDGVTFSLERGSAALLGANGAGKTTLMLAAVGVLPAARGAVRADSILLTPKTVGEVRRRVGLVFQNPDDQLFMPTIREDVAFGPRNFGFSRAEIDRRTDDTLALLGIERLAERSPLRLSGGEKRLAAVAAVLAADPTTLLLDEPAAFLDPRARRRLIGALNALPHPKLISTHDLRFAEETCTRVLLLREGRLYADGGLELLRDAGAMDACGLEPLPPSCAANSSSSVPNL